MPERSTALMWTNTSLPAIARLNEAEALGSVEPLDGACSHLPLLGW